MPTPPGCFGREAPRNQGRWFWGRELDRFSTYELVERSNTAAILKRAEEHMGRSDHQLGGEFRAAMAQAGPF